MQTCGTCTHWSGLFCGRIEWTLERQPATLTDPGSLVTSKDFGCTLHEAKDK